jgi:phospholipid transport system substrate-binding protein
MKPENSNNVTRVRAVRLRTMAWSAVIGAFALVLLAGPMTSRAAADEPMGVVKGTVNQALDVLRNKQAPLAQRQGQLRQIVAATFDFKEMARSALGYHWRQLSPAQQDEFTKTFVAFIEDSYLSKLNEFTNQQVEFVTTKSLGQGYAQVNSNIVKPGSSEDPTKLDFLLEQEGSTWKIYDVKVDAISIIANYRNQFNRVMNNKGYDTLISDLKSKQAALAASLGTH